MSIAEGIDPTPSRLRARRPTAGLSASVLLFFFRTGRTHSIGGILKYLKANAILCGIQKLKYSQFLFFNQNRSLNLFKANFVLVIMQFFLTEGIHSITSITEEIYFITSNSRTFFGLIKLTYCKCLQLVVEAVVSLLFVKL